MKVGILSYCYLTEFIAGPALARASCCEGSTCGKCNISLVRCSGWLELGKPYCRRLSAHHRCPGKQGLHASTCECAAVMRNLKQLPRSAALQMQASAQAPFIPPQFPLSQERYISQYLHQASFNPPYKSPANTKSDDQIVAHELHFHCWGHATCNMDPPNTVELPKR